ncbi:MAG: DUF1549 domain-containing protein [Planctomycetes bacterium]|nr:DUF1549 domain-containing protein [Planctomycetota bacterium]
MSRPNARAPHRAACALLCLASVSASAQEERAWWSLRPIAAVAPPAPGHPVDAFLAQALAARGLAFAELADDRTLYRRLHFDLLGLAPSPEEVEAYAADRDPAKYERLVERLLASPRYGERWARHWLDLVHYGDTHGFDKDQPRPHAWPYRDYVIRALNEDKPYARFVEEQLAGDALYPSTRDGIEALGFLAAGPWDLIGHIEVSEEKIDGKIARHQDRDDMVATTLGTFTSTTAQCAQCHDHKFDPITQRDYYALQAVFAAVDRADKSYDLQPALASQRAKCEQELRAAQRALENARAGGNAVPPVAYGFHAAIAARADEHAWVQVDLGASVEIERLVLHPCWDDFAGIGAGFGFPRRLRVELAEDAAFTQGVVALEPEPNESGSSSALMPRSFAAAHSARYVRVTALELAERQKDFAFALAELEALDRSGVNRALGAAVTSSSSIEMPPRWAQGNLVDGITPSAGAGGTALARVDAAERTLRLLPAPKIVYAATVHHGSGNFRGTGASGGAPREIRVLRRGQVTQPGELAPPAALPALEPLLPSRFELPEAHDESARRAALARWIVDPRNPLTWRSIANRVWMHHFGSPLVATPNDFGRMGELPSHPELLDWLATQLRDELGGSLKALHRLLVTSHAYRQSSQVANARAAELDRGNRLLWRASARKLEAEAVRDAILQMSGALDLTMGGPGWQDFVVERPEHSPHYRYDLADPEDPLTFRRAIYRFVVRSQTQPFLSALDCADPSMRVERRNESLSAAQALALLNSGFVLAQAERCAARIEREVGTEPLLQVARAVELAFQRALHAGESERLSAFVAEHGLASLCRVLWNASEFVFVD